MRSDRRSPIPRVRLGRTAVEVSRLGFGTYPFGLSARRISPETGGRLLLDAHGLGVTYWDTSDDYRSHPHVAWALSRVGREEVTVSTKTYARTGRHALESLERSLRELGADHLDLFLLHYVQADWIDGCRRVLEQMADIKRRGWVRAIGLSTHSVTVARAASRFEALDAIMAICCRTDRTLTGRLRGYVPLEDGRIGEMRRALAEAHRRGKAVIAIKVMGGGAPSFTRDPRESIRSLARAPWVDVLCVGMSTRAELQCNLEALESAGSRTPRARSRGSGRRFRGGRTPRSRVRAAEA